MAQNKTIIAKIEIIGLEQFKGLIAALSVWAIEQQETVGQRSDAETALLKETLALAELSDPAGEEIA